MSRKKSEGREAARRIVRRHLAEGEPIAHIAREEGVQRSSIYYLLREAEANPEGAMEEARSEYEFRREVWEMLGD